VQPDNNSRNRPQPRKKSVPYHCQTPTTSSKQINNKDHICQEKKTWHNKPLNTKTWHPEAGKIATQIQIKRLTTAVVIKQK